MKTKKFLLFILFAETLMLSRCTCKAQTTPIEQIRRDSVKIVEDWNNLIQIKDKAGAWLIWKKDSDTLELIPPTKVHFIKIGKKIIKL